MLAKMIKVAIYIRVSTQEQAKEGYSLGEQEDRLKAYCTARGWTIAGIYRDGGFSGSDTNRPALQKLIKDVQNNSIDLVLVYKLDRLSRSQKDTLNLIEDVFIKHNVDFVSMSENFDTSSPFGRAMIGILSVFAQLEREQIRERMQLGAVARAKEGYFHGGGFYPIGYDYVNGELVINEYEAMQIRKIYELFLKGYPISRIRKIMSEKYTNKYGNWYSDASIRSCLTTPIYYGKITYAGVQYDGKHQPIVTEEEFNKVQNRLAELSASLTPHRKTPFKPTQLLSGIIWCGNCGARYYTHHINGRKHLKDHKGWDYYACYSKMKANRKMVTDPNCKNKSWRVDEVNKLVIDEILKLQFDETYLKEFIDKENENNVELNARKIIEARIKDVSNQLDKIMDLYQLGSIPLEKVAERIEALNNERNGLENELFNLNDLDNKKITLAETKAILKNAKSILESNDMDIKRMLIHSLIERIELFDTHIKIHWTF